MSIMVSYELILILDLFHPSGLLSLSARVVDPNGRVSGQGPCLSEIRRCSLHAKNEGFFAVIGFGQTPWFRTLKQ